ncbi:MAG: hypothetical protein HYY16_09810 [Planctomycetes bacterium]|nr:hypothetical protein [Planctomycetota bacterium]
MGNVLVVQSKVKEFAKKIGGKDVSRFSGDAVEELSKRVEVIIKDAVKRAKENKRGTVQGRDI